MDSSPLAAGAAPETAWHALSIDEVLRALDVSPARGLSADSVRERRARLGDNRLAEGPQRPFWKLVLDQLRSLLILLLVAAAFLALFLGERLDAGAILVIVAMFVVLGAAQEWRAQNAIAALKRMAAPMARVLRDGVVCDVPASDVVPGDVLKLEAGTAIPADARLVEVALLRTEESSLTGESVLVEKQVAPVSGGASLLPGDRRNMVFMGTSVGHGRGTAVVVETGMRTELGRVATLVQSVEDVRTPLQEKLDGLGRILALAAVGAALLLVLVGLWRRDPLVAVLLSGVSLAVAVVPEGLPAVLTFTLSVGARRMLARKALIRRLPSVETLGSVTVICSDKTGTLTQNRMTVTELHAFGRSCRLEAGETPQGFLPLLAIGASCNDGHLVPDGQGGFSLSGDPTETALLVVAEKAGLSVERLAAFLPRRAEIPFDSSRKRMTTLHAPSETAIPGMEWVSGAACVAMTKGAPDGLIPLCSHVLGPAGMEPMTPSLREEFITRNARLAAQGRRVLAMAFRLCAACPDVPGAELEADMVFVGLVAMVDPPRPEVRAAVETCRNAGIRPVMITGDHPLTARAIAAELGMVRGSARVVSGDELEALPKDALARLAAEVSVFARVSPEHKLRIVEALQSLGHVVAMTGDGVNDAPALKKADIGIAMGSGTDVAREASDMVLLDDNFATIVAAVEEGRVVFDNLRRFVLYSVGGNLGKVLAITLPPLFFGMPLVLLPIQILWLNLMTDGLLGLGLGFEKAEPATMMRPPIPRDEGVFSGPHGRQVLWVGGMIGGLAIIPAFLLWQGGDPGWQATLFSLLAVMQVGQALSARSFATPFVRMPPLSNRVLLAMVLVVLGLQAAVVYLPLAQRVFATVSLPPMQMLSVAAFGGVVLFAAELLKHREWRLR